MNEPLRVAGGRALPMGDRAVPALVYRRAHAGGSFADLLFLFCEARRVLRPGGTFRLLVAGDDRDDVDAVQMARLVGLEPVSPVTNAADAGSAPALASPPADDAARPSLPAPGPGERALDFRKRMRRVTGSPLVTLAIPAYSPRFFDQALASAIAQTYDPLEIIVCDDSPGDAIEEVAQRLGRRRAVRYQRNGAPPNARANYRRCLELARGEFIKYLNDDDILAPDAIARLLDGFRRAPDVTLATSYRARIGERGEPLPDERATRPIVAQDSVVNGLSLANAMLTAGVNVVGEPSTVLFRKADLLDARPDCFGFNGVHGWGVIDMSMWSTLLLKGDAAYLREPLCRFRIHPGQHQLEPAVRELGVKGVLNLQAAWRALGLHLRIRADRLQVTRLGDEEGAWQDIAFVAAAPPTQVPRWRFS
jgi:hypothetical protein